MTSILRRQKPTLLLIVGLLLVSPLILRDAFWTDNSVLFAIFSLLALSVGLSYGQAGVLSIATGAFAALGAYSSTIATTRFGLSPYVGLLLALFTPMALAYPLARTVVKLSPLPLSIATLVLGSIIEIAIREGGDFTGGYVGISGIPSISIATAPWAMHILTWACVAVVVFIYCNVVDSAFGRAVATSRHDALRAVADGVDVPRTIAKFFSLSAAVAGLAGWLYAHCLSYVGPDSLNTTVAMQALLMAMVGGVRSPLGPILGTCLLLTVVTYLPAAESQGMVYGGTLILILLVAPQGLIGTSWSRLGFVRFFAGIFGKRDQSIDVLKVIPQSEQLAKSRGEAQ